MSSDDVKNPTAAPKTNIKIETGSKQLRQYSIQFPTTRVGVLYSGPTLRPRKSKSRSPPMDSAVFNQENVMNESAPKAKSPPSGKTGIKLTRKRSAGALANLNIGAEKWQDFKQPSVKVDKDVKRIRLDTDISMSAEDIPVETAFPATDFGAVNQHICPEKQMRLQRLISSSPLLLNSDTPLISTKFRIARKY